VGLRAGLESSGKFLPHRDSILGPSSPHRLRYTGPRFPSVCVGKYYYKGKLHLRRPGQVLWVLEVEAARISETLALEGYKFASPTHREISLALISVRG
jgi:hypothetical protein